MSDAETNEAAGQEAKQEAVLPEAGATATATPPAYRPPYALLVIVAAVTLAADLGTKYWAMTNLSQPFERREIIDGFLGLVLAHNPGGAWGLLHDESPAVRVPFFIAVSIVAIGFIVSLYRDHRVEAGDVDAEFEAAGRDHGR